MTSEAILDHAMAMLQRHRRGASRTLRVQWSLHASVLEALKDALLYAPQVARSSSAWHRMYAAGTPVPC